MGAGSKIILIKGNHLETDSWLSFPFGSTNMKSNSLFISTTQRYVTVGICLSVHFWEQCRQIPLFVDEQHNSKTYEWIISKFSYMNKFETCEWHSLRVGDFKTTLKSK